MKKWTENFVNINVKFLFNFQSSKAEIKMHITHN